MRLARPRRQCMSFWLSKYSAKAKSTESTPKGTKRSLAPTPVKRPTSKLVDKVEVLQKVQGFPQNTNTENESQRVLDLLKISHSQIIQPRPPSTPPTHTTDPVLAKIFEKARPTVNRQSSDGPADQSVRFFWKKRILY